MRIAVAIAIVLLSMLPRAELPLRCDGGTLDEAKDGRVAQFCSGPCDPE
jgi:hypothetical protein